MLRKSTLIIGSGKHAVHAAEALSKNNINVFLCAKDTIPDEITLKKNDHLHIFENTRIVLSKGCIGDFRVTLDSNGTSTILNVSTILIAEEYIRKPAYEAYGISDSFSVTSLSNVLEMMAETVTDIQQTAVFLTGISYENHPIILEDVMKSAMSLQKRQNLQVYIFTGNLKVAQNGLESMYRDSRKQGIVFIKSANSLPEITQTEYGSVTINFLDELSCEQFRLKPDTTIVDEIIAPDDYLIHLAQVFGLDTDPSGFLQTENVHRTSIFTNVGGILVAGPSRCIQSASANINDVEIACNEIQSMFATKPDQKVAAEIFNGNCIRCLTCIRVCPYNAIVLNTKPEVMANACEACGICAAKCPRQAITLEPLTVKSISERIARFSKYKSKKTFTPHIIAFCCARSALTAYEHARQSGYTLPKGLKIIDVPCGGAISFEHILYTLKSGADGVMIATCHDGNCHGEQGNQYARSNGEMAQDILVQTGIEKERVMFTTIASNMGTAFAEKAISFNKLIKDLGPSQLVNSDKQIV